jgi:hypothetical protein
MVDSHDGLARRVAAVLAAAMIVVGCAPRPDGSPSPAVAATILPSPSPSPSAASAVVTWCPITRGDGSLAEDGPHPAALPASLPVHLVPLGAVVYGVAFPPDWGQRPYLYALGPAGARCGVDVGTGFVWSVVDASNTKAFRYEESWSVDPVKRLGCRYLESARRAYMASIGATSIPEECATLPDYEIVGLPAVAPGLELALVWFGPPGQVPPEVDLYGYRPEDAAVGELGFRATCATGAGGASRCRASLAFVAAALGGEARAADAIRDAFPGGG